MAAEILYTSSELLKIYISGAVLAIATVIIAWYGGKYVDARYKKWVQKKNMEQRIKNGEPASMQEIMTIDSGINKKVFFVVGGAVIIVGIVQVVL